MPTGDLSCRSCLATNLRAVLSLGETPLANSLLEREDLQKPEARYPLDLAFCPRCTLLQITVSVPPEKMFSQYLYISSFSETFLEHARQLAEKISRLKGLGPKTQVIEAASNDGYLLQYYVKKGIPVLGVEPASNIAKIAEGKHGIPTRNEFFSKSLADCLIAEGMRADVFHAHNVLGHVPDLNEFVAGIAALLRADGWAVIEVPYVKDLLDHTEFDTIYHEHLSYFSLTSLRALFERHDLRLLDVERMPIHGGSLRVIIGGASASPPEGGAARVSALLQEEKQWHVEALETYTSLAAKVARLKIELVAYLRALKSQGKRLAAYGASAKGSTLLNYFQIGSDILDFVVDKNTHKQGRFTPGTHLPIRSPEALLQEKPDFVLLLTWNFVDEILKQQAPYRDTGGKFIVPIPEVRTV